MTEDDIALAVGALADRDRFAATSGFPEGLFCVEGPGLYAWWADGSGMRVLTAVLGESIRQPIYAGQSGATQWPSGKRSSATLASRIRDNHLSGPISRSTLRFTLAALLSEALVLHVDGKGELKRSSTNSLDRWMRGHLSVSVYAYRDRDALKDFEGAVLDRLDPPLNLRGRPRTRVRRRISERRGALLTSSRKTAIRHPSPVRRDPAARESMTDTQTATGEPSAQLHDLLERVSRLRPD